MVPQYPNVLILLDGNTTYQSRIPTVAILDNLFAAHRIGPTVAIFVDNGAQARQVDLNFSDPFLWFLTTFLAKCWRRAAPFSSTTATRRTTPGARVDSAPLSAVAEAHGEVLPRGRPDGGPYERCRMR
jgi:enterochelin esterase-like enzyme